MERLNGIKGAVFDLDGTLLDSMDVWEKIDRAFLRERGIALPPDYVDAVTPLGFYDAAVYTIRRFGLSEAPEELTAEWHRMAVDAYAHEIKLKPFAREYLIRLSRRGVRLGVATALDGELYIPALRNNGVYELFEAFTSLREVRRGKGSPDIYLETAKKLNLLPSDCAVFEDIYLGIRGAKAGGFLSVAVYDKYSESEEEEIKKHADLYIRDFGEL